MIEIAPLLCQKEQFSLRPDHHYLNNAYMAPIPKLCEAAAMAALTTRRDPGNLTMTTSFAQSDGLRSLFGRVINAPPERIAIIPSVSYAVATLAKNTPLSRGQNIVMVKDEFPSDVYCWQRKACDAGAEIRFVSPPEGNEDRARRWSERILDAIDGNTVLVTLACLHWTDGTLFDVHAIRARTLEVGAAFVIDGSQSIGALPFDVTELQADAVFTAGYKWLLGPYKVSLAYYGSRYDDGCPLEESWMARKGSEDLSRLTEYTDEYAPGAARYDTGQRSDLVLVPMSCAAIGYILDLGISNIQAYAAGLANRLTQEVRDLDLEIERPTQRAGHLFGVRFGKGVDTRKVAALLLERKIAVSIRAEVLRVSINMFNDEADVCALAEGLSEALRH